MGNLRAASRRLLRTRLVIAGGTDAEAVLEGLDRLGVHGPVGAHHAADHGPLFVLGTFGTVIALERAVALGARWGWSAPCTSAVAAVALLARQVGAGAWLTVVAAAALLAVNGAIVRRQAAAFTVLMGIGSAVLLAGNVAWALGRPVFEVVPAWIGFFVLTIVGERLELSRLAPTPRWARNALVAISLALVGAALFVLLRPGRAGMQATGALLVLVALWELSFDVARRLLRQPGLPRFAATGVLLGVGWLLVAGVLLVRQGLPAAGPAYDAVVHAVLVGFVLSMVMAHAPIILPAVARIDVTFHRLLYLPLVVLHGGLVARILGDLAGNADLRRAGGIANAVALLLLPLAIVVARRLATKSPHP